MNWLTFSNGSAFSGDAKQYNLHYKLTLVGNHWFDKYLNYGS